MITKSNIFRGAEREDVNPTYRADLALLGSLPENSLKSLANIVVEDARRLSPSRAKLVAKAVVDQIRMPYEQARSLVRVVRSLSSQMIRTGDKPGDISDDLVLLDIIPKESKDNVSRFLEAIYNERAQFMARVRGQQVASGGGYHLTSVAAYPEIRAVFSEIPPAARGDDHVPELLGFLPSLTLELEVHQSSEDEKTIAIRLSEDDLSDLENALKAARREFEAIKKKIPGV